MIFDDDDECAGRRLKHGLNCLLPSQLVAHTAHPPVVLLYQLQVVTMGKIATVVTVLVGLFAVIVGLLFSSIPANLLGFYRWLATKNSSLTALSPPFLPDDYKWGIPLSYCIRMT
jgi:hypothetical protein